MNEVSDFGFELQIECYVRIFLNMISGSWLSCVRSSEMFVFPHELLAPGERVLLYGAGDVGKSYYCSIMSSGLYNFFGWVDKRADILTAYNGQKIRNIYELSEIKGDKILVAVKEKATYIEILEDLKNIGIDRSMVIWKEPIIIG